MVIFMDAFTIKLTDLEKGVENFDFYFEAEDINDISSDISNNKSNKTHVFINARKFDDSIYLEGRITGNIELICVRCLEKFNFKIDKNLQMFFMEEDFRPEDDEIELEKKDLSTFYYQDDVIKLKPHLLDIIALEIPQHSLCSEQCQGIDYDKGFGEENEQNDIDPRWQKLKNLKLNNP